MGDLEQMLKGNITDIQKQLRIALLLILLSEQASCLTYMDRNAQPLTFWGFPISKSHDST